MPLLTLRYNNEELHTYQIGKDQLIKIGRSDLNEITLDDNAVSNLHAEIEYEAGAYYITDIQSKNGTFVDGELVISRKLHNGNHITIGNYTLTFQSEADEAPRDNAESLTQSTMMIDTSIHRSRLAKSLAEIREEQPEMKTRATLTFLNGTADPVEITPPVLKIGKGSECDIKIKGLFAGKSSAEIFNKNTVFYIRPATEKCRIKLNYKILNAETALKNFDVIEAGSTKLQFHLKEE